jgi:Myb/SANT-like DNA-binding domain
LVSEKKHFEWTEKPTKLLISLYAEVNEAESRSAQLVKKKDIWRKIAAEMNNKGYDVGQQECDEKFRRLKRTYREKKDERSKTGRAGGKKWLYYDDMDDLEGSKASVLTVSESAERRRQKLQVDSDASSITQADAGQTVSDADPAVVPSTSTASVQEKCQSAASANPSTKKRKVNHTLNAAPPAWFAEFAKKQNEFMDGLQERLDRQEAIQREKNEILKSLVEFMKSNK